VSPELLDRARAAADDSRHEMMQFNISRVRTDALIRQSRALHFWKPRIPKCAANGAK
jgi:hypothetical protein